MLRNAQEAQDVTQWTYLRAIETGFEVRSRGQALKWLYLTASQRCLTILRNEGTRRRIRGARPDDFTAPPPPSPERLTISRDLLHQALSNVDERTAQVALLTYVQGLSTKRAAEICETSLRTVLRARSTFEAEIKRLDQKGGE